MNKKRRLDRAPAAAVGLGLVAFVLYKAVVTSFTHDESFTTLHFFPQPERDILLYRHAFTSVITNNHILNTLLMKLSESVFGLSEWALRLPNVMALVLYLLFGYLLCGRLPRGWMRTAAFLMLLANPYALDFFGLARGYGLSMGTMVGSVYYLQAYLEKPKGRRLLGFHLLGILAVMSNFALLNFYAAALFCLYALPLLQGRPGRAAFLRHWAFHGANALAVGILSALIYTPFKVILENNTVSFGGKQGFFADTVRSLVQRTLYETTMSEPWITAVGAAACVTVLLPAGLVLWKLIRQDRSFFSGHALLTVVNTLCWLIALMTVVQHHWLGQDYLEDRFAVFLFPLFALNLVFALHWLWQQPRTKTLATALLLCFTLVALFHTLRKLNTSFYLNWKYDKDTKAVMEQLQAHQPSQPDAPQAKIGIHHQLEPTMNLYRRWWSMYWIEEFNREAPAPDDDYYYILESEFEQFGLPREGTVLFQSPENNLILLKNNTRH